VTTAGTSPSRRAYIDWLRGVAVAIMILAHTTDSWTATADKATRAYDVVVKVSGMAAPLFLFLAGVAVALAAGGRARKTGDVGAAAAGVRRRGWQIFGLALLFRLQAMVVSGGTLAGLLKVDILNIMGPAMVGAAAIWGLVRGTVTRVVVLSLVASGFSLLTPYVRTADWIGVLPDPLEWYIRPPRGRSWFTLFPWAGLLCAGAAVGVVVDQARSHDGERRLNTWFLWVGAAIMVVSIGGSFLPSPYSNTYFWTTSPSYFFLRIGLMIAMLGACYYLLERWPPPASSAMLEFGHSSLFVYWIHVEMAYGWLSYPLHKRLPLAWALVAYVLFTMLMLWLSRVKTRRVKAWKARRARASAGTA